MNTKKKIVVKDVYGAKLGVGEAGFDGFGIMPAVGNKISVALPDLGLLPCVVTDVVWPQVTRDVEDNFISHTAVIFVEVAQRTGTEPLGEALEALGLPPAEWGPRR